MTFIKPTALDAYIEVVGRVNLTAYAVFGYEAVLMYMSGPQTSVDSVRAKIAGKKPVNARLGGANTQVVGGRAYNFMKSRDEVLYLDHAILVSEAVFAPLSGIDEYAYVIDKADNPDVRGIYATTAIGQHIRNLVDVQVLYQWFPYLIDFGINKNCINALRCQGCTGYAVSYDKELWTDAITRGLKNGKIGFAASTSNRLNEGNTKS